MKTRCEWVSEDPIYQEYHDKEWGMMPQTDTQWFEQLCLEGAQAGLSWLTILKKREYYRKLFKQFDIQQCSELSDEELEHFLLDARIVRNRLKVFSVRKNAFAALQIQQEYGSLAEYFMQWVQHQPKTLTLVKLADYPTSTQLSDSISKDLKKRGFSFTGTTIIYAFMQATGMVQSHASSCFLAP